MCYFAGDFLQLTTNVLTYFFYYFSGDCMKILLLLFILSISIASSQQPEWYHLDCHLLKVAWTSNTSVYAVGTNGALLRSTDKGASWRQIPTLVSDSLIGIAFSDSLHGTAVGQDGILLTSADGGISWHLQKNVTNFTLRSGDLS